MASAQASGALENARQNANEKKHKKKPVESATRHESQSALHALTSSPDLYNVVSQARVQTPFYELKFAAHNKCNVD